MDDWDKWLEMRNKQRNTIVTLLIVAVVMYILLNFIIVR